MIALLFKLFSIYDSKYLIDKVLVVLTLKIISTFYADNTYYIYKKPPIQLNNPPRLYRLQIYSILFLILFLYILIK